MRRSRILVIILLVLATLAACSGSELPRSAPTPSKSTSSAPAPTVHPGTVVYGTTLLDAAKPGDQADLWLYDPATNTIRRLTNDGRSKFEEQPRFFGDDKVTFVVDDALIELDLLTGARRTILRADGRLLAYAVDPNLDRVAYIDVNYERDSVHHLRVRNLNTGRTEDLRKLGVPLGRGGGDDDIVSIAWDSRGERLLINDTHLDDYATVRVMSAAIGEDMADPIKNATGAFWSKDERSIFVIITPASPGTRSWYRVDLADGSRHRLTADPKVVHARISPDGTKIAATTFATARNTWTVYVYDIRTGKQLLRKEGFRDPLWLTIDTFAATGTERCPSGDDSCGVPGFRGLGTSRIALDGDGERIALGTTFWLGSSNTDVLR